MRLFCLAFAALIGLAQQTPTSGPYKVLRTAKVGGAGGFDYVYADTAGRRLYIARGGMQGTPPVPGRVTVFDLDTLEPVGEIPNASARGAALDSKSGHGFASSKPVVMWDTKTLATIKTIDVEGGPDGILSDPSITGYTYLVTAHSDQGRQPGQLRCGTDRPDDAKRQNADLG